MISPLRLMGCLLRRTLRRPQPPTEGAAATDEPTITGIERQRRARLTREAAQCAEEITALTSLPPPDPLRHLKSGA